jgi:hypothetical protein
MHECKGFLPHCLSENTAFRILCFQKELFTSSAAHLQPKNVSTGSQDLGQGQKCYLVQSHTLASDRPRCGRSVCERERNQKYGEYPQ